MLEIQNLSAGYGKKRVLEEISFSVCPGEMVGIVGPNGCGKSTLLKAIPGILAPMGGSVSVDSEPITGMNPRKVARKIAYFSQNRGVPPMTVEELVLHGRYAHHTYPVRYNQEDRQIAREAMERMGLLDVAGEALATLSGGMRQMAYLAMTLAQGSDYILLDEPTSFLDVANRRMLMGTLAELTKAERGILVVLHDLPLAMTYCHRVVLMDGGRVLAAATPDEIGSTGLAERVFGVPLKKEGESWMHPYK
ncbi:MAG: ABC transporter ATP-binding protein [Clostridia bacterium]|nr:ABC transporter ATP-binding protein [Clostridia bacterium]